MNVRPTRTALEIPTLSAPMGLPAADLGHRPGVSLKGYWDFLPSPFVRFFAKRIFIRTCWTPALRGDDVLDESFS
jgi:hypothetical protein